MPRVVLDTVILVRGLIKPSGVPGRLMFKWAGHYRLVVSPPLLTEYLKVLSRPELTRKFRSLPAHLRDLLDLLSQAEIVTFTELPTFDRDPNDAHVLATAVQGGVDYLISADNDLLDLGEYEGIRPRHMRLPLVGHFGWQEKGAISGLHVVSLPCFLPGELPNGGEHHVTEFEGIPILSAPAFLRLLEEEARS